MRELARIAAEALRVLCHSMAFRTPVWVVGLVQEEFTLGEPELVRGTVASVVRAKIPAHSQAYFVCMYGGQDKETAWELKLLVDLSSTGRVFFNCR